MSIEYFVNTYQLNFHDFTDPDDVMKAILESRLDSLSDALNKKLACALVCSFHKGNKSNQTLHTVFTESINYGNPFFLT